MKQKSIRLVASFVWATAPAHTVNFDSDPVGSVPATWTCGVLEKNVALYYTEGGSCKTLKYVDAPVARGDWHTLRVEFTGTRIAVSLDDKRYIAFDDGHIAGPGAVGVWTKAVSVTAFDKDANKLTLKHGPIKNLDMPGMTMVFQVKDPAMLENLAVGDKIKVNVKRQQGAFVVTAIEKTDAK